MVVGGRAGHRVARGLKVRLIQWSRLGHLAVCSITTEIYSEENNHNPLDYNEGRVGVCEYPHITGRMRWWNSQDVGG